MFNDVIAESGKPFNIRKATTDHWYSVAIGTSEASISINLVNKESSVVVELYISDNKDLFDALYAHREEIEKAAGCKLEWRRLNNKKASRILSVIPGLNFGDHSNYKALMQEIIARVISLRKAFSEFL